MKEQVKKQMKERDKRKTEMEKIEGRNRRKRNTMYSNMTTTGQISMKFTFILI